ncbi:MAG: HNH endonuclease [Burkholderiales bacterium]|nr:HNH endonuclease [Burkholderiales bacterium]
MRYWVGVTDKDWFTQLRRQRPEEVNFWQPSPSAPTGLLQPGVPFLFKLHYPDNYIVGGGFFVRFSTLPARLAWEAFGEKNGVADYATLRRRIQHFRGQVLGDPEIGCNLLCQPFFFDETEWIKTPASWSPNIVRGKTFDTTEKDGQNLWLDVAARLGNMERALATEAEAERYGMPFLTRARLGQGSFRVLVTDAYQRRCAVSAERTLPVLEAAHIKPYSDHGPHQVSNGLLLRADLHKLFDEGYLTVTEDYRVRVSPSIRSRFENGREYYRFDGATLAVLPSDAASQPSRDFLKWHNESVFIA